MKSIDYSASREFYPQSQSFIRLLVIAFTVSVSLIIPGQTAQAQTPSLVCPSGDIQQITEFMTSNSSGPSVNGNGTLVAFTSAADINGGNPDGNNEIFIYNTENGVFTQVTNEMSGESIDALISLDGNRVVFQSNANINNGNPEGNTEIFLYDVITTVITQITSEPSGDSEFPAINSDGTRIVFQTNANINGGNPELNHEIYLYDTTTAMFQQITNETTGASLDPDISDNGIRIGFHSSADINGGNPEMDREMFIFDTISSIFTQVTSTPAAVESFQASLNGDGTRMVFHSSADLTGNNPDNNIEVFLYDSTTDTITQITNETAGLSADPTIDSCGTRIVFESNSDINGGNPEGNFEIYLFDTVLGMFIQITSETTGDSVLAYISGDGSKVGFESTSDINNGNPDMNNEVFLAMCYDPFPTMDVMVNGGGTGTVNSMPPGIECGGMFNDCTEDFPYQTDLTLDAMPEMDSFFAGWGENPVCRSGAPICTTDPLNPVLNFTIEVSRSCIATFELLPILDIVIEGQGTCTVTSEPGGIDCPDDCTEFIDPPGSTVMLTAEPDLVSEFVAWSGDCTGQDPTTSITVNENSTCVATCTLKQFVLNPIFPALDDNINFISTENSSPNSNVAFVWGKNPGQFTLGGQICNGATLGIDKPKLLAIKRANQLGVATYIFYIPQFGDLEFAFQLQALDIDTCRLSNQINQVIRKD